MTTESTNGVMTLEATDVTGTRTLPFEFPSSLPAESAAATIRDRMALPDDVTWGLRDDTSSEFLTEDVAIGEQLAPGSSVTITPRTHLGAVSIAAIRTWHR